MSTQSIKELTRERYLQESEDRLLQLSDAYFYKKKFLLGEGVDRDELRFTMQSHRLLSTDNCEMMDFIADKIAGKLEECNYTVVNYDFEALMEQHTKEFKCSEQDTLNAQVYWEESKW